MLKKQIFNELFDQGVIPIKKGDILGSSPAPLPGNFDFQRIRGMLLGLAIGDSLGNTSESRNPEKRYSQHGYIENYLPNHYAYRQRVGLPSDDTQLTFWTIEQMLVDGRIIPDYIACRFAQQEIYGIGSTMKDFLKNYKEGGIWYECGPRSAGNGALMRIAPVILPYLLSPAPDIWIDTVLLTMLTHNDSAAIASSLAFVSMLWELLRCQEPPSPEWYLNHFVQVLSQVEFNDEYALRGGIYAGFKGTLSEYLSIVIPDAWEKGLTPLEACNCWYSGAYLFETVPSLLYILMKCGNDPKEAVLSAVNHTRDNDTVAALVGAAMGALYGIDAFPVEWINYLTGQCGERDIGRLFNLINRAEKQWWIQPPVPEKIDKFEGVHFYLYNYAYSPIKVDGIVYPTIEHAFHAAKTPDIRVKTEIAAAESPDAAKRIGRHLKFCRPDWDNVKIDIMWDLLKRKFSRYPDLMGLLINTGQAELIEGNWWGDKFWGVCNGEGRNELGKLLMKIRSS